MEVYYYWDPDTKQFDSTVISDKEIRDANATTDSLVGLCQPIYRDTENNKWIGSDDPGLNEAPAAPASEAPATSEAPVSSTVDHSSVQ